MKKRTVYLRGMHCKTCEMKVEGEFRKIAGVSNVHAHSKTGRVDFEVENEVDPNDIDAAAERAGYTQGREVREWIAKESSIWGELLFSVCIVFVLYVIGKMTGIFELSLGTGEEMSSLGFVFLLGIAAGFSTCMAIIGGMVLAVSARYSELHPEADRKQKFIPHVFFNIGRIVGFSVLGGVLGALGSIFELSTFLIAILTILVGGVMLLLGIQLLELFPVLSAWKLTLPKALSRRLGVEAHTEKTYHPLRTGLLGALTFFLPCGFTQAVQLFVITQGDIFLGAATLGTFALGTTPGLLGIGGIASLAEGSFRRMFFKIAGIIVIALGIVNIRGGVTLVSLGTEGDRLVENVTHEAGKDVRIVRVTQRANGYFPNDITVKKGEAVRLIVDSEESYSCAVDFTAPKLGIRQILDPGENVFDFVPTEKGSIPFSCGMGMYNGIIRVVE